jgi:CBS domain-containing protein
VKVSHIISGKPVKTISPSSSIQELVNSLKTHQVGALVVSDDGKKISGIVSERDVVRALSGNLDRLEAFQVKDLMTSQVHTCNAETTVEELMKIMTERRIRHIPVVDDRGELVSIVSIGDVVKYYVSEIELERQSLKEYITGAN